MAITLRFNVRPGDVFAYQSTFTSRRDGKTTVNTTRTEERIVAVSNDVIQVSLPDDPDLVMAYDARGLPIDVLQGGRSVKAEMPGEMFDISNQVVFPVGPVNPGDTWDVRDGVVHVSFRFVGTGTVGGREAAEIHSTESSYYGPIKHWVELATGRLARKEYQVGAPDSGTTTVIERV